MSTARGVGTVRHTPSPRDTAVRTAPAVEVLSGSWPITPTSPSSHAHQKSGSFPPPALPGLNSRTTLSDSRRAAAYATSRPLPSPTTGLPRLPASPFRRAVPTTPADRTGARVDCVPAHAAFPNWPEGRHPHCHFRHAMGERRGCSTLGAESTEELPMANPNDLSRSLMPLGQNSTMIAVIENSSRTGWSPGSFRDGTPSAEEVRCGRTGAAAIAAPVARRGGQGRPHDHTHGGRLRGRT